MKREKLTHSSFPGKSLVITPNGLREIQYIEKGDLVLTGSNKFALVNRKLHFLSELLEIKGHGHPIFSVTKAQEILATNYKRVRNPSTGKTERKFNKPGWILGENMKGNFWASPAFFLRTESPISLNEDIAWLMGAYLGNGFVNYNRINFLTNHFRCDELENRFKNLGIRLYKVQKGSIFEYYIIHAVLADWLKRTFDLEYSLKNIPFWVYGMDEKYRQSFFNGFIWGNGVFEDGRYRTTVNNKYMAIGIKLIAQTLGYSTALYLYTSKKKNKRIERWQIVAEVNARSSTVIGNNRFGLVREIKNNKKIHSVYGLEIAEGDSLIVDGLIVRV